MNLRNRATGLSLESSITGDTVGQVLYAEIEKRLALEEALRRYLKETPSNPFKAASDLLEFLEKDEREEGYIE